MSEEDEIGTMLEGSLLRMYNKGKASGEGDAIKVIIGMIKKHAVAGKPKHPIIMELFEYVTKRNKQIQLMHDTGTWIKYEPENPDT